jgi:peptide/nickel transport system substrate-binding protein
VRLAIKEEDEVKSSRCFAAFLALSSVAAIAFAGCGGGGTAGTTSSNELRLALAEAPAPLDPDTFYEANGTIITGAVYERLLQYKPNSPRLVPMLATSWKVSPDGKKYTFALREGVKFSDGTPFDAAAAKASLERRTALEGGPSYMLENVASYDTPDENTLVVNLKEPQVPFLDYLASPFGPAMTSPTTIKKEEKNGDHAAAWLGSHSAGTGPYVLSEADQGVRYTLTPNKYYWGKKPAIETVSFTVVPDPETQRLQLEGGTLDAVLGGLTTKDDEALEAGGKVDVYHFPALLKAAVWVNPESQVFGSPTVRQALRESLDNTELTKQVYGNRAKPSTEAYPPGMLPKGAAPDEPKVDPAKLEAALAPYKGDEIVIGWWADSATRDLANLIQVKLHEFGLNASVHQYSGAETFTMAEKPSLRPDLFAITLNPDAVAPDTWARIYWRTGAPVNMLGCSVPAADKLLDEASRQTSKARSEELGVEAAERYMASNCWLNIADVYDTIAVRKGLTGIVHQLPWLGAIELAAVKPE